MGYFVSRGRGITAVVVLMALGGAAYGVHWWLNSRDGGPPGWRAELRRAAAEFRWVVNPEGRIPLPLQHEIAEVSNDLFPRERWGMAEMGRIIELIRLGRAEVEAAARGRRGEEEVESRIGLGLTRMLNPLGKATARFEIGAPMDADAVAAIHAEVLDMVRSSCSEVRFFAIVRITTGKMFNNPDLRRVIEEGVHDPEPTTAAACRANIKAFGTEAYMKKCEEFWRQRGY